MEKYLGRNVTEKQVFQIDGTFESMYAAERWISEKGYDAGSTCVGKPAAIMKGNYYDYGLPHKWKNFTKQQMNSVYGVMVGYNRNGPVYVYLFELTLQYI